MDRKKRVRITPRFVWKNGGEGPVWFSVYGTPLDHWANDVSFDIFFNLTFLYFQSDIKNPSISTFF